MEEVAPGDVLPPDDPGMATPPVAPPPAPTAPEVVVDNDPLVVDVLDVPWTEPFDEPEPDATAP